MPNHKSILSPRILAVRTVVYFGVCLSLTRASVANKYYQRPCPQRDFPAALQNFLSSVAFNTKEECVRVMCAPKFKRPGQMTTPTDFNAKTPFGNPGVPGSYVSSANKTFNELRGAMQGSWYVITDARGNPIGVSTQENVPTREEPSNNQYSPNANVRPKPVVVDSNVCCSTVESYYINETMVDITGATRTLAQIQHTGSYQIIRHGFCGKQGVCPGVCEQVYVTLPLAIVPNDPGQIVTYRYFNIPGYCSCKVRANGF